MFQAPQKGNLLATAKSPHFCNLELGLIQQVQLRTVELRRKQAILNLCSLQPATITSAHAQIIHMLLGLPYLLSMLGCY